MSSAKGWKKWLRVARGNPAPATLSSRYIYILPTRYGVLFAAILLGLLVGSINYALSLGFVVTFLLAGMAVISMLHTWRNLAYLVIDSRKPAPVFASEDAAFEVIAKDSRQRARFSIAAHFDDTIPTYADIVAAGESPIRLLLPTEKRGWLKAERVTLFTEFPLGLFYAWSYVALDARCMVYPKPATHHLPLPASPDQGAAGVLNSSSGDDDFAGHRAYQLGDSPKRVDWKASSREQGLLTKQFQGEAQSTLWLDWVTTPGTDNEQRISQLTRWVIDAHGLKHTYGLRIPGSEISPNNGEVHYHRCLEALAFMDAE
jgi:uncharacterized protein (DUF58 family)